MAVLLVALGIGWVPAGLALAAQIDVAPGEVEIDENDVCSLREAIENANDDASTHDDCTGGSGADTIRLAAGSTYSLLDGPFPANGRNGLPSIISEITVEGNGATIERDALDCNLDGTTDAVEFRLFHLAGSGNLTLNELTLRNGCADGLGHDGDGGVIFNDDGATLTIIDSTIEGNSASDDGGLYNGSNATLTVVSSTFTDNSGQPGGAIFNSNGIVIVTNSTFAGNATGEGGGAIFNFGQSTVTSSTFYDNSAVISGGGINNSGGRFNIKNSIVADNAGGDCDNNGTFTAEGDNLDGDGSCPGFTVTADPMRDPTGLADNGGPTETIALMAGSPAVDVATDCTDTEGNAVTEDQRGFARPVDADNDGTADCDLGAYEAPLFGDATGEATVDVLDARICLQIAEGVIPGTNAQRLACDVNGDGDVTRADAERVGEFSIGLVGSVVAAGLGLSALLALSWLVVWRRGGDRR